MKVPSGDGGPYSYEAPAMAVNSQGQVIGTQVLGLSQDRSRAYLWSGGA